MVRRKYEIALTKAYVYPQLIKFCMISLSYDDFSLMPTEKELHQAKMALYEQRRYNHKPEPYVIAKLYSSRLQLYAVND